MADTLVGSEWEELTWHASWTGAAALLEHLGVPLEIMAWGKRVSKVVALPYYTPPPDFREMRLPGPTFGRRMPWGTTRATGFGPKTLWHTLACPMIGCNVPRSSARNNLDPPTKVTVPV